MDLTIVSVIFGGVLLSAVVFKYIQRESRANLTLTCFLTLFGFALVASPAWTNISWKSSDIEFQLVRETTQQMDDYVRILSSYDSVTRDPRNSEYVSLISLATELRNQKKKIEVALSEGNLEQAITETKLGTQLIDRIANTMDASQS
ncbi:MAG: hypothetical protein ABJH28_20810 [Paraglaciecola sp.]|uniref:hypothetical protein n=1 Tax=Paraglaciecola TaxID=1621534 RepID=UPI00105BAF26|nr:hypothetical protein [Paraglaciecola marina]